MFLLYEMYQGIYRYKIFLTRIFFELKINKRRLNLKAMPQQVINYTINGANHKNSE